CGRPLGACIAGPCRTPRSAGEPDQALSTSWEVSVAGRRCPGPSCPRILTQAERYCPDHARAYEAKRGSSTARGYGTQHQRLRAAWQARVDRGEVVRCPGCGVRIAGTDWDRGHAEDRTAYRGPEGSLGNRSDGGKRGNAARRQAEA